MGTSFVVAVSGASAADLNHYNGYYNGQPRYYGADEPWSVTTERPPRKGRWYFTDPTTPTVNFLVPMSSYGRTITPWTPEWEAYCAARWASFNPRTGTVVTPDGVRMCF
ncbi:BA14K family protein [Acuticoccus sp. I52.16.1]|uniref:BA14K family protein n=1 Tax=Acuticoccus sp. I52.16.1 TaxID=2928472 RepID=UPI001FD2D7D2|nr:BA14K family protein [Acuticoccus sp. I52.16.1]UOM32959.1 BA14K family protein [Acuticoccus sp. I52.16.1]